MLGTSLHAEARRDALALLGAFLTAWTLFQLLPLMPLLVASWLLAALVGVVTHRWTALGMALVPWLTWVIGLGAESEDISDAS